MQLFLRNEQSIALSTAELKLNFDLYPGPFICRGIGRLKLIDKFISSNKDFYYLDSGYFGNSKRKTWHRITKNNLQNIGPIIDRDENRLKKIFNTDKSGDHLYEEILKPWKRNGDKILICPSNEKYMNAFELDHNEWLENVINTVSKYTDKQIIIRERPINREEIIVKEHSLSTMLNSGEYHALITYSSNAAVESVINGVPVFILGMSAALPVGLIDLSEIERPIYSDRRAWLRHLSYCQFNNLEIEDGTALKILQEY